MKVLKEDRNIHLKEQMLFSEILEGLKEIEKIEQGDKKEGAAERFCSLFSALEEELHFAEEEVLEERNPAFDESILPREGELLAEGESLCLLGIAEEDREGYMEVEYDTSFFKAAFSDQRFLKNLWNSFHYRNRAYYSIFSFNGLFLGYCGIRNLQASPWELCISLKKQYQGRGIGTESLRLLMKALKRRTGESVYRGRVDADNEASIGMMRKLGAKANGISESFLHGERLMHYQRQSKYLIDERLQELAEEFAVPAEELLGHLLEFRIEA